MEEEINYSTLVFYKSASPSKEENEEKVIYSDVKIKDPPTTEPTAPAVHNTVKIPGNVKPESHAAASGPGSPLSVASNDAKEDATVHSGVKPAEPVTTVLTKDKAPAKSQSVKTKQVSYILLLGLAILCIFLVATITGIVIYYTLLMKEQETTFNNMKRINEELTVEKADIENKNKEVVARMNDLENQTEQLEGVNRKLEDQNRQVAVRVRFLENQTEQLTVEKSVLENQTEQLTMEKTFLVNRTEQLTMEKRFLVNRTEQLTMERRVLENRTDELSRDRDKLNWTLGVILTFNTFPVNDFCNKTCQPCRTGWIYYNKKCYLFYNESAPWMTWTDSRQYCRNKNADLVVVDDLQEQVFLMGNIKFYYDGYHGFWMGLQNNGSKWFWIDGREDTLKYWRYLYQNLYGLMIPGTNMTNSWNSADDVFLNKFICEDDKALIWFH